MTLVVRKTARIETHLCPFRHTFEEHLKTWSAAALGEQGGCSGELCPRFAVGEQPIE
ncbi:MAG: hypothetical protein KAT86_06660 [Candidatus Latescibacteria bacterium]|nr:hypothetical protein [Candidatus Latescibacterota bacterium]